MTIQTKLIAYLGIMLTLIGFYLYLDHTITRQKQAIETLKVEKHTIIQNVKTEVAQVTLDKEKDHYEETKVTLPYINTELGSHRMYFKD